VKAKLSTGEISINQAYQEIKKEEKVKERKEYLEQQKQEIEEGNLKAPVGLFDIISVDPPWPYGREYDPDASRVANPYPEMSIDEIKNINLPLTNNSVIFLWTTHAFLPDAFDILKKWGATYKATIVWNKKKIGMGAWFRMQCEFCLVGIIGKPYWSNTQYPEIIEEPRREHSRKPDVFFNIVDQICAGRKLEYFSRESRNGWENFGNEPDKF
jgi:N6-adenosine-specific RNA methylase IME4